MQILNSSDPILMVIFALIAFVFIVVLILVASFILNKKMSKAEEEYSGIN